MLILFLADGSSKIGMGHVYRSINLANELKNDYEIIFITREKISFKFFKKYFKCFFIDRKDITKEKKIFSIYPGSRLTEVNILLPILFNFIKLMNERHKDILFIFHCTSEYSQLIKSLLLKEELKYCEVISDDKIKSEILKKSIFAVAKSGTVSLEICNFKIPSIIIYKMNSLNFFIVKSLVKVKFANIINIAANKEIIPELLQSKCNSKNIFNTVNALLNNKNSLNEQVMKTQEIIDKFRTNKSSEIASSVLLNNL